MLIWYTIYYNMISIIADTSTKKSHNFHLFLCGENIEELFFMTLKYVTQYC